MNAIGMSLPLGRSVYFVVARDDLFFLSVLLQCRIFPHICQLAHITGHSGLRVCTCCHLQPHTAWMHLRSVSYGDCLRCAVNLHTFHFSCSLVYKQQHSIVWAMLRLPEPQFSFACLHLFYAPYHILAVCVYYSIAESAPHRTFHEESA